MDPQQEQELLELAASLNPGQQPAEPAPVEPIPVEENTGFSSKGFEIAPMRPREDDLPPGSLSEAMSAGLGVGTQGMFALANRLRAMTGILVGASEETVTKAIEDADAREFEAELARGGLESFGEFWESPSLDGFLKQASYASGYILPSAAQSVGAAAVGGVIGAAVAGPAGAAAGAGAGAAGGKALVSVLTKHLAKEGTDAFLKWGIKRRAKEDVEDAVTRKVSDLLEKKAKDELSKPDKLILDGLYKLRRQKLINRGLLAGASVGEYSQVAPDMGSELFDPGNLGIGGMPSRFQTGVAFAAALLPTAVGVGGEALIYKGLMKHFGKEVSKATAGKDRALYATIFIEGLKGAVRSGGIESVTELIQEYGNVLFRELSDPGYQARASSEVGLRLGEAAFIGLFGSAPYGGAGSGAAALAGGIKGRLAGSEGSSDALGGTPGGPSGGRPGLLDTANGLLKNVQGAEPISGQEPVADLNAQIAEVAKSDSPKKAAYIMPEDVPRWLASLPEEEAEAVLDNLFRQGTERPPVDLSLGGHNLSVGLSYTGENSELPGLLIQGPLQDAQASPETLQARQAIFARVRSGDEASLQHILGYAKPKPRPGEEAGAQVIGVRNQNNEVVHREAVGAEDLQSRGEALQQLYGVGNQDSPYKVGYATPEGELDIRKLFRDKETLDPERVSAYEKAVQGKESNLFSEWISGLSKAAHEAGFDITHPGDGDVLLRFKALFRVVSRGGSLKLRDLRDAFEKSYAGLKVSGFDPQGQMRALLDHFYSLLEEKGENIDLAGHVETVKEMMSLYMDAGEAFIRRQVNQVLGGMADLLSGPVEFTAELKDALREAGRQLVLEVANIKGHEISKRVEDGVRDLIDMVAAMDSEEALTAVRKKIAELQKLYNSAEGKASDFLKTVPDFGDIWNQRTELLNSLQSITSSRVTGFLGQVRSLIGDINQQLSLELGKGRLEIVSSKLRELRALISQVDNARVKGVLSDYAQEVENFLVGPLGGVTLGAKERLTKLGSDLTGVFLTQLEGMYSKGEFLVSQIAKAGDVVSQQQFLFRLATLEVSLEAGQRGGKTGTLGSVLKDGALSKLEAGLNAQDWLSTEVMAELEKLFNIAQLPFTNANVELFKSALKPLARAVNSAILEKHGGKVLKPEDFDGAVPDVEPQAGAETNEAGMWPSSEDLENFDPDVKHMEIDDPDKKPRHKKIQGPLTHKLGPGRASDLDPNVAKRARWGTSLDGAPYQSRETAERAITKRKDITPDMNPKPVPVVGGWRIEVSVPFEEKQGLFFGENWRSWMEFAKRTFNLPDPETTEEAVEEVAARMELTAPMPTKELEGLLTSMQGERKAKAAQKREERKAREAHENEVLQEYRDEENRYRARLRLAILFHSAASTPAVRAWRAMLLEEYRGLYKAAKTDEERAQVVEDVTPYARSDKFDQLLDGTGVQAVFESPDMFKEGIRRLLRMAYPGEGVLSADGRANAADRIFEELSTRMLAGKRRRPKPRPTKVKAQEFASQVIEYFLGKNFSTAPVDQKERMRAEIYKALGVNEQSAPTFEVTPSTAISRVIETLEDQQKTASPEAQIPHDEILAARKDLMRAFHQEADLEETAEFLDQYEDSTVVREIIDTAEDDIEFGDQHAEEFNEFGQIIAQDVDTEELVPHFGEGDPNKRDVEERVGWEIPLGYDARGISDLSQQEKWDELVASLDFDTQVTLNRLGNFLPTALINHLLSESDTGFFRELVRGDVGLSIQIEGIPPAVINYERALRKLPRKDLKPYQLSYFRDFVKNQREIDEDFERRSPTGKRYYQPPRVFAYIVRYSGASTSGALEWKRLLYDNLLPVMTRESNLMTYERTQKAPQNHSGLWLVKGKETSPSADEGPAFEFRRGITIRGLWPLMKFGTPMNVATREALKGPPLSGMQKHKAGVVRALKELQLLGYRIVDKNGVDFLDLVAKHERIVGYERGENRVGVEGDYPVYVTEGTNLRPDLEKFPRYFKNAILKHPPGKSAKRQDILTVEDVFFNTPEISDTVSMEQEIRAQHMKAGIPVGDHRNLRPEEFSDIHVGMGPAPDGKRPSASYPDKRAPTLVKKDFHRRKALLTQYQEAQKLFRQALQYTWVALMSKSPGDFAFDPKTKKRELVGPHDHPLKEYYLQKVTLGTETKTRQEWMFEAFRSIQLYGHNGVSYSLAKAIYDLDSDGDLRNIGENISQNLSKIAGYKDSPFSKAHVSIARNYLSGVKSLYSVRQQAYMFPSSRKEEEQTLTMDGGDDHQRFLGYYLGLIPGARKAYDDYSKLLADRPNWYVPPEIIEVQPAKGPFPEKKIRRPAPKDSEEYISWLTFQRHKEEELRVAGMSLPAMTREDIELSELPGHNTTYVSDFPYREAPLETISKMAVTPRGLEKVPMTEVSHPDVFLDHYYEALSNLDRQREGGQKFYLQQMEDLNKHLEPGLDALYTDYLAKSQKEAQLHPRITTGANSEPVIFDGDFGAWQKAREERDAARALLPRELPVKSPAEVAFAKAQLNLRHEMFLEDLATKEAGYTRKARNLRTFRPAKRDAQNLQKGEVKAFSVNRSTSRLLDNFERLLNSEKILGMDIYVMPLSEWRKTSDWSREKEARFFRNGETSLGVTHFSRANDAAYVIVNDDASRGLVLERLQRDGFIDLLLSDPQVSESYKAALKKILGAPRREPQGKRLFPLVSETELKARRARLVGILENFGTSQRAEAYFDYLLNVGEENYVPPTEGEFHRDAAIQERQRHLQEATEKESRRRFFDDKGEEIPLSEAEEAQRAAGVDESIIYDRRGETTPTPRYEDILGEIDKIDYDLGLMQDVPSYSKSLDAMFGLPLNATEADKRAWAAEHHHVLEDLKTDGKTDGAFFKEAIKFLNFVREMKEHIETMTVGHELGHVMFRAEFNALRNEDGSWTEEGNALWEEYLRDVAKMERAPRQYTSKARDGLYGFEEWWADKFSAYLAGRPVQERGRARVIVERIVARLKKWLKALNEVIFGGRFTENQIFTQYADLMFERYRQGDRSAFGFKSMQVNQEGDLRHLSLEGKLSGLKEEAAQVKARLEVLVKSNNLNGIKSLFLPSSTHLASLGAAGKELAEFFQRPTQTEGALGLHEAVQNHGGMWVNALHEALGPDNFKGWNSARNHKVRAILTVVQDDTLSTEELKNSEDPQLQAAGRVRDLLQRFYTLVVTPAKADVGYIKNYSPRRYNLYALRNSDILKKRLANALHEADPDLEVKDTMGLVEGLIEEGNTMDWLVRPEGAGGFAPGMTATHTRAFTKIKTSTLQEIGVLEDPLQAITSYLYEGVRFKEYQERGGIERIGALLERVAKEEDVDALLQAERLVTGQLGLNHRLLSPALRVFNSYALAITALTTLAFAAIGSLSEIIIPITRSLGMVSSLDGLKEMVRTATREENKELARAIGVVVPDVLDTLFSSVGTQEQITPGARNSLDFFFSFTRLNWVTSFSRNFAAGMGREFLKAAAAEPDKPRNARFLKQLGVTAAEVTAWVNDPKGVRSDGTAGGHGAVYDALARYVRESTILATPAGKPALGNDPRFSSLYHLTSFHYEFGQRFLGGFGRESARMLSEKDYVGVSRILLTVFGLMLPVTALGLEFREYAKFGFRTAAEDSPVLGALSIDAGSPTRALRTDSMSSLTYINELMDRTGLYGPFSLGKAAGEAYSWGENPILSQVPILDFGSSVLQGDVKRAIPVVNNL